LQAEGRSPEEIREVLEALNVGRLRVASKGIDRAPPLTPDPSPPKGRGEQEADSSPEGEGLPLSPLSPRGRGVGGEGARFAAVDEEEQHRRGMYMIGQAAGLRDRVVTMAELHADVCEGSTRLLEGLAPPVPAVAADKPSDIAIVGMACLMPGADGLRSFWENVLAKVDAVTEVPA